MEQKAVTADTVVSVEAVEAVVVSERLAEIIMPVQAALAVVDMDLPEKAEMLEAATAQAEAAATVLVEMPDQQAASRLAAVVV